LMLSRLVIERRDEHINIPSLAVFRRLVPLASQHNLRLIFVNRRDYPGSSPYSDEDLRNVQNVEDGEGYERFFKARGSEFAKFTEWIITHESIPKADWENNTGGVFMLAWSAGNAYALPILSYVDLLSETTRSTIEPYFRGFIIFDAPRWFHGLPLLAIATADQAFKDESISPEERARTFSKWVGGYYKHPTLASYDVADLQKEAAPDARQNTPEAMTKEELAKCTDYNAVLRSEIKARTGPISGYAERIRLAAFDYKLAKFWPKAGIHVIWCECSPWPMVETAWTFEKLKEEYVNQGVHGRTLTVEMMPDANHFPHWDEPEMTIAFFAKAMAS